MLILLQKQEALEITKEVIEEGICVENDSKAELYLSDDTSLSCFNMPLQLSNILCLTLNRQPKKGQLA